MELEIGMYVRTNKWGIAKYVANHITKSTIYRVIDRKIVYDNVENWEDCLLDNEITIASHNIINLIQVGDYVNDEKITRVISQDICGDEVLDYQHIFVNDKEIFKHEIKSIVTKEQFENMSYKVGE